LLAATGEDDLLSPRVKETMRGRLQIGLAVLLITLAGILFWQARLDREPVYQGKRLSAWLNPTSYNGDWDSWQASKHMADEAVIQIGTNGLPCLLRMLQAKDSAFQVALINALRKQRVLVIHYTSTQELHVRARHGFELLGPQATSAVPALIGIASQSTSRSSKFHAIDALGFIGPSAVDSIPFLLQTATNADFDLRSEAIFALGRIHSELDQVVPALTNALHDSYPAVRVCALIALEQFGPEAKNAVPALLEFVKSDSSTRSIAALKAIDPQAAATTGFK